MKYNHDIHKRRSIRLKEYDYSAPGTYFITICAKDRYCLFGDVEKSSVILSCYGQIVSDTWHWLASRYDYVQLDEFVVMPNHVHGILIINDLQDHVRRGGSRTAPTPGNIPTPRKPLGRLVGAFKTVSTKQINLLRNTPGHLVWQRNYYERVIRNDRELNLTREYIRDNPLNWGLDNENPKNNLYGTP